MRTLKELMTDYDDGEPLTTPELKYLRVNLAAAEDELSALGYCRYHLVVTDLRYKLETVDRYLAARQQRF